MTIDLEVKPKPNEIMEKAVLETMSKIETYITANRLKLNSSKTKIIIFVFKK